MSGSRSRSAAATRDRSAWSPLADDSAVVRVEAAAALTMLAW